MVERENVGMLKAFILLARNSELLGNKGKQKWNDMQRRSSAKFDLWRLRLHDRNLKCLSHRGWPVTVVFN